MKLPKSWIYLFMLGMSTPLVTFPQSTRVRLIPDEVIASADSYIADAVGESYFKNNYVLDQDCSLSAFLGRGDPRTEYTVCYIYLPASRLSNHNNWTRIKIRFVHPWRLGANRERIYEPVEGPYGFVGQLKNGDIVEPTVSLEEAITAAEEGFGEPFDTPPVVYLTTRSLQDYQFAETRVFEDEWIYIVQYRVSGNIAQEPRCVVFAKIEINAVDRSYRRLEDEEACAQRRGNSFGSPR